jgi:hypothetical protein
VDELGGIASLRGAVLTGTTDNETITTAGGDDVIDAGLGNDAVSSGGGDDRILDGGGVGLGVGGGPATNISAGDGNDTILIGAAFFASGSIDGGNGTDTFSAGNSGGSNDVSGISLSNLEILEVFIGSATARAD